MPSNKLVVIMFAVLLLQIASANSIEPESLNIDLNLSESDEKNHGNVQYRSLQESLKSLIQKLKQFKNDETSDYTGLTDSEWDALPVEYSRRSWKSSKFSSLNQHNNQLKSPGSYRYKFRL